MAAGPVLLRAAAVPCSYGPRWWPDPARLDSCRRWLDEVWSSCPGFTDAVAVASPGLAGRVEVILAGQPVQAKQVRRAAMSVTRYLLRATGRHTPFGLFAGVASVSVGQPAAWARWGNRPLVASRADTQWLGALIEHLESDPDLLDRLDVVSSDLAIQRGDRLEISQGSGTVSVAYTAAVRRIREQAAHPTRVAALAADLQATFGPAKPGQVRAVVSELVRQGFLITCLRSPMTCTDPLTHVVDRLQQVGAAELPGVAVLAEDLTSVAKQVVALNDADPGEQAGLRAGLARRMGCLSQAGRTPLAVDVRLDCTVQVPEGVIQEIEWAGDALARLSRYPGGEPGWRAFHTAFHERFGTGTRVRLLDALDPDTGVGYPGGYPGSQLPAPAPQASARDAKLLNLAWAALAAGSSEIVLDEATITDLSARDDGRAGAARVAGHVEIGAQIRAHSAQALQEGDYTLTVAPARAAGTLTGRFAALAGDPDLEDVFTRVPTLTQGALAVQLSVPPAYGHAENICRTSPYLPDLLSLGEHRIPEPSTGQGGTARPGSRVIGVNDLALTATRTGIHLVHLRTGQVIEPQAFHGLALDKQPPPVARFLAHLSRGQVSAWHQFDWGPIAQSMPYLPRVRYRRSVLSPARWRLSSTDLTDTGAGPHAWAQSLDTWRARWSCPDTVLLRDDDKTLPLTLTEPAHRAILHAHLTRHDVAVLTETAHTPGELGWIGGHAHQIVVPLFTTQTPAPPPRTAAAPRVEGRSHGQLPGGPGAPWLHVKIYTHPQRMNELLTGHLPGLLAGLGHPNWWFIRYRTPTEPDHLRLRIATTSPTHTGDLIAGVGAWAQGLRESGISGRICYDIYQPEVGRYGTGVVLDAAEAVFTTDSQVVTTQLTHRACAGLDPAALTALNMIATATGLLRDQSVAMRWFAARPPAATPATAPTRVVVDQVARLVHTQPVCDLLAGLPGRAEIAPTWQARATALLTYRRHLAPGTGPDLDDVLESLLHMHHNRATGIDRDDEITCRRIAYHAARAWIARREGTP